MAARVTRSKKVEIAVAEDNTAATMTIESVQSPYTGMQIQPLAEATGNNTESDQFVENELKHLKAAFRSAIGPIVPNKKGRKGKNKKKVSAQESEEAHLVRIDGVLVRHEKQGTSQGSLINHIDALRLNDNMIRPSEELMAATQEESVDLNTPEVVAQPAARTTRRQAKAQEGPYENLLAEILMDRNDTVDVRRPKGFLVSLIAGRDPKPSRSFNSSTSQSFKSSTLSERLANDYLAEEAIRKSSREAVEKESNKASIPDKVIIFEIEPEPKEFAKNIDNRKALKAPVETHSEPLNPGDNIGEDEDSFVEKITSRSPAKPVPGHRDSPKLRRGATPSPSKSATTTSIDDAPGTSGDDDNDSFVEHISSRSPAKTVSRIEDSVEALDEMEKVEEALQEAAMAERMVSPEKTRQKVKVQAHVKATAPMGNKPTRATAATKSQPGKPGYASMRVKSTVSKQASVIKKAASMTFKPAVSSETSTTREEASKSDPVAKKAPVKRPTSLLPPKDTIKSAKPLTRPTKFELPGEAVARKLKEQREARIAQRSEASDDSFHTARQPSGPAVKSTKPLTKPSFELPGEAISRRKKEAHEAKFKAQAEEERKRREFKAKPVRKSMVSTIRDTVASRARQSKVGVESIADGNLTVSKRGSTVGAHRPSILELASMANTSAPRAPASAPHERKPSTKFHGPSMSGLAMQRTVSASDVHIQKQRAKEIYNRDHKLAEDIERERREREAAAKRSREEAAERGRQASRDWAAKQLVKKIAEGDKGQMAGYGPGGQMGLEA